MSGIVGLWNLDGRPVEESLLDRMSARLAHRGPDGEGRWVAGPVGLACQQFRVTPESARETQPLVDPSGAVLVFDGRLDNRAELLERLKDTSGMAHDVPDPALILAAYHVIGARVAEWLAGDFALALFDPRSPQLLLARDAIGVRPLYYCHLQRTVLFASEIKALLAHPDVSSKPNDELLANFLLARVYDHSATFVAGIRSLPPAHAAVVTPTGLTTRRYWDFDPSARIRLGSFQDYADAFRHVFGQAVQRRLRSRHPVAVSVSGGLDSSSILCLAHTLVRTRQPAAPPVLGASYTSRAGSPSDEQAFLLEIEQAYGMPIHRVPLGPMALLDHARQLTWHVEAPFLDEQWGNTRRFLQTVNRLGARVLLTGHWGDQMLFPQAYLVDLVRRLRWRTAYAHLREFPRWMTDADPRWFRNRFVKDLVKYHLPAAWFQVLRGLRDRCKQDAPWYVKTFRERALRSCWSRPPPTPRFSTVHGQSLYDEIRIGHHVLCMEWENKVAALHGLEMAFPFLDRDLLTFLMGIPGEVQTHQGVPKALLRHALQGVLPEAIAQRRWKADFTDLVNDGVERDYPQLIRCLDAHPRVAEFGYVNEHALRTHLDRLRAGLSGSTCASAWALSDLLGLELWLRTFCENGHATRMHVNTGGVA